MQNFRFRDITTGVSRSGVPVLVTVSNFEGYLSVTHFMHDLDYVVFFNEVSYPWFLKHKQLYQINFSPIQRNVP